MRKILSDYMAFSVPFRSVAPPDNFGFDRQKLADKRA